MRLAAPDPDVAHAPHAPGEVLLQARGVAFAYGRTTVLDGVNLEVRAGEFVALVGPNGSGKSTLLKVLLGSLQPTAGEIRLLGSRPDRLHERSRIGYVPQRPVLDSEVPATLEEIVATGRLARRGWWRPLRREDREQVTHALRAVGLEELSRRPLNELSGGQQQRAFIARAFASEPELLLLDEPIAGVDAESQRRFRDSITHLIHEHGAGVLLVSHELSAVAPELDRVIVLKRRVLFDGPPSALSKSGVSLGVHHEDLPLWLEGLTGGDQAVGGEA
jgi:zinc transport system ATP-binding protein